MGIQIQNMATIVSNTMVLNMCMGTKVVFSMDKQMQDIMDTRRNEAQVHVLHGLQHKHIFVNNKQYWL